MFSRAAVAATPAGEGREVTYTLIQETTKEISMSYFTNDLHHLAARACTGDAGAAVALRRELQPHMLRIVRRALRSTTGASALTERIRAAVDRLSGDVPAHRPTDSARLVRRVAHDI